jgi:SanA protein
MLAVLIRILRISIRGLSILLGLGLLVLLLPRLITSLYTRPRMFSVLEAPPARVALVFGAGLTRDGRPTTVLRDRVATAADLYHQGKVEKLLMSGDNRFLYYNEPGSMKTYALELGVPEGDIVLDFAGRRTYDSCYRAREIFGIREAILVTQGFHLPRAVYTCSRLGITSTGVAADQHTYRRRSWLFWNLREVPATLVALWEVNFSQPVPVLGDPEPIFPFGT